LGNLRTYTIKRLLSAIPTLLGISVITFGLIHLAPGGPLAFFLQGRGGANAAAEALVYKTLEKQLGLDQPVYVQYLIWLKQLLTGNFGTSYLSEEPISSIIGALWVNTMVLALGALMVSLVVSVPLGVVAALRRDSIVDHFARVVSLLGVSMPGFYSGIIMIYIFAVWLGWFPVFGSLTAGISASLSPAVFANELWHLALPLTVLSFQSTALLTRLVRGSMLEVLNQEYVTTARAKGVKDTIVIYKHALRNALLPVVTVVGLSIGFLLSGAVVVEQIFSWPGLGQFVLQSTLYRDYPAIMATAMIVSTMVVISTIATDLAYAYLDPRIRY
jgi:peptide/nickel transport system permease protein